MISFPKRVTTVANRAVLRRESWNVLQEEWLDKVDRDERQLESQKSRASEVYLTCSVE